ncbi:MAG: hypothetical protein K0S41_1025 [Anaerocolumna sp.]|jgi:hypothetical protein|nr:hypothetical protein [Anaerocolumna sp.]
MTFRELLEGYKAGTLTDDERYLVEQELEKSEAINDYLAEEIEKSIGYETELDCVAANDNVKLEKSIRRTVNRRLATIVAISVAFVFVINFFIQNIVSPIVASKYYDPTKKTGLKYSEDLLFDLRAITEVSMPGYEMTIFSNAENLGFGKYNLTFTRKNIFTKEKVTVNTQINKNMRVGSYEDFFIRDYFVFREFWDVKEGSDEYKTALDWQKSFSNTEIEHVRELPSTTYISAWVRFPNDLSMKELYKVIETYKNINFNWVAIRTAKEQGQQLMGFLTDPSGSMVTSETVDEEKYPGFQMFNIFHLTGEYDYNSFIGQMANMYETHFTSLIKYLVDHKRAVSALVGNSKNYDYKSVLDYINQNGISTYGALIYGEADDMLELYDSGTIMTFDIDNVLASKYIQ